MKTIWTSLRCLLVMTVLTGAGYTLLMTGAGRLLYPDRTRGSLVIKDGKVIGSALIAQNFTGPRYFHPRPSAVDYNPLPSGGSNLGPTSLDLKTAVEKRRALLSGGGVTDKIPADLLFASGSGLDPHISPEAARFQAGRVAKARGMDAERGRALDRLIVEMTEGRTFGILGEPRVNVLILNMEMEKRFP